MEFSPIAIFAYNRPRHLSALLESLLENSGIGDSPIYFFVDGPRLEKDIVLIGKVVEVIQTKMEGLEYQIIQRETNSGLANSLISGITQILRKYDSVIVLEDDLKLASNFIQFCNEGLDYYRQDLRVASIQGYTLDFETEGADTYFLRGSDCWGWATWANRWECFEVDATKLLLELREKSLTRKFDLDGAYPYTKMLERTANGQLDSWAIRWHASMFLSEKYSLYPAKSLVENMGRDGSGVHPGDRRVELRNLQDFIPRLGGIPVKEEARIVKRLVKATRSRYQIYSLFNPRRYLAFSRRKMLRIFKKSRD